MKKLILLGLAGVVFISSYCQEAFSADTLRKDALKVYLQANDFIRREIPYINYMRDIKDADLYIISSTQKTGSGGIEYTYFLVGQKQFAGMRDTLKYVSSPDDTQDNIRKGQVQLLKQGLMRYVMTTPLAKHIHVSFSEPLSEEVSTDKWNNWVFSTSINGMLNGQKTYNTNQIFGKLSARRITSDWKLDFGLNYNLNLDYFHIDDQIIKSVNNGQSFNSLIVRSLSDHWSTGGSLEVESSTFNNYKLKITAMPGIEYDIFPYSESTRRQLRLLYRGGYIYQSYMDTTIYNKLEEHLWGQRLSAAYQVLQKWGSIDVSVDWFNYLHDWSKNNLSLNGSFSVRIAKGLNIQMGGGASLIHDQLSLVKGGATREEILLKRKVLATQYMYFTYFGLSYTFGSIYNNVVNPRFGGSSGGMTIIMN